MENQEENDQVQSDPQVIEAQPVGNPTDEPKMTPQEFIERYNALCEESGWQIIPQPVFVATNHGTFEVQVNAQVGRVGKPQG